MLGSLTYTVVSCQDSLLVRALDLRLKGCEFESRQEWWENFLLQCQLSVLTLIRCHVEGAGLMPGVVVLVRLHPLSREAIPVPGIGCAV